MMDINNNYYKNADSVYEAKTDRKLELPEFKKLGLNFALLREKPITKKRPVMTEGGYMMVDTPDYDTQRAYGAWKTRPDLQKEFPDFYSKTTPSKWSMKDWYDKYGKAEYSDPAKNFFKVPIEGVESIKDEMRKGNMYSTFDRGKDAALFGLYIKSLNKILYDKGIREPLKTDTINHEISHYLLRDTKPEELMRVFGNTTRRPSPTDNTLTPEFLAEVASDYYAEYKRGKLTDKKWIKYFKELEEINYK